MKKIAVKLTAAVMCGLILTGCSASVKDMPIRGNVSDKGASVGELCVPDTLEFVLNKKSNKKEMDEQCESIKKIYSSYYDDIRWESKDNNLSFIYIFVQDFTDDQIAIMKTSFDEQASSMEDSINDLKDSCEKDLGVRPETISDVYLTKSGKEICTFSK